MKIIRFLIALTTSEALLLSAVHAVEFNRDEIEKALKDSSSSISKREAAKFRAMLERLTVRKSAQAGSAAGVAKPATAATGPSGKSKNKQDFVAQTLDQVVSPDGPWQFVVRKDFADIGVLANAGGSAGKATGATISFSNDRVAKDVSWMLQGVGTLGYTFLDPAIGGLPIDYAQIGIYGGVNKFTNTNAAPVTKSLDNVIDGGYLEVGTASSVNFDNYFRINAGTVTNNIATRNLFSVGKTTISTTESATQLSLSGVWMPVWDLKDYLPVQLSGIHKGVYPLNFEGSPYKNLLAKFEPEFIIRTIIRLTTITS